MGGAPKPYPVYPEVYELFKDRLCSQQLLIDISNLLQQTKNDAYATGYRAGTMFASARVQIATVSLLKELAPTENAVVGIYMEEKEE